MRGDGSDGCFPSQRKIAESVGIAHRTAGRDLNALESQGWIQTEKVRRQYGKNGRRFFPAIPDRNGPAMSDPIQPDVGSPSVTHSANGSRSSGDNGSNGEIIGSNADRIGSPSVTQKSLSEISNSEGAAPPSPAAAGYAAPSSEEASAVLDLVAKKYTAEEIADLLRIRYGLTCNQVQIIIEAHRNQPA